MAGQGQGWGRWEEPEGKEVKVVSKKGTFTQRVNQSTKYITEEILHVQY